MPRWWIAAVPALLAAGEPAALSPSAQALLAAMPPGVTHELPFRPESRIEAPFRAAQALCARLETQLLSGQLRAAPADELVAARRALDQAAQAAGALSEYEALQLARGVRDLVAVARALAAVGLPVDGMPMDEVDAPVAGPEPEPPAQPTPRPSPATRNEELRAYALPTPELQEHAPRNRREPEPVTEPTRTRRPHPEPPAPPPAAAGDDLWSALYDQPPQAPAAEPEPAPASEALESPADAWGAPADETAGADAWGEPAPASAATEPTEDAGGAPADGPASAAPAADDPWGAAAPADPWGASSAPAGDPWAAPSEVPAQPTELPAQGGFDGLPPE